MIGAVANRLTAGLLVLCVLLGGIVARELQRAGDRTAWPQPAALETIPSADPAREEPAPALPAGLPSVALQAYQEMLERPLFVRGRTPPPEPQRAVVKQQAKPPNYLLEGVAISRDMRVALLRDLGTRSLVSVVQGASLGSWVVQRVEADRVVLARGEEIEELPLEPDEAQRSGAGSRARQ